MDTPPALQVTIYSTATCHFCHMAKEYFTAHGIAFTDYNVGEDMARRADLVAKSGQLGVPVITVADATGHEEVIIGFDEEHLAKLLNIA